MTRRTRNWIATILIVCGLGYCYSTLQQEGRKQQELRQKAEAQRQYAEKYIHVAELEVTKISDGFEGDYAFSVLVTNLGEKTLDYVSVHYLAPREWGLTCCYDPGDDEPSLLVLGLFCRDPTQTNQDRPSLCGPGESFRLGISCSPLYFGRFYTDQPSPKPAFDPRVLRLSQVSVKWRDKVAERSLMQE